MPANGSGGSGGRALRDRSGRDNNTNSQSNQDDAPQHVLSITGLEIITYPPGVQPPTGSRRRVSDERRKTSAYPYAVRSPPRKNEVVAKLKDFLTHEAPPGTAVGAVSITAQLAAGAFTSASSIRDNDGWNLLLRTMKDNVHKPVKFMLEWTKEAPTPSPPPPPAAASQPPTQPPAELPATQPFSFTGGTPPPPYRSRSSTSAGPRARSGTTTARGRRRREAEEMDLQRHEEIDADEEVAIALWDKHPRCQEHSNGHADNTHCYIDGAHHYRLTYNAVATWATAVNEDGASMLSPPPHVFQMLTDFTPRARGPVAANHLAAQALQIMRDTVSASSTTAAADTSSSSVTTHPPPAITSGPSANGNAKFWTVWGLDKRSGSLNKDLVASLHKQNAKTMAILARARQAGVLEREFSLTGIQMMIIDQWIDEWHALDVDESLEERQNSIIEAAAAAAGE